MTFENEELEMQVLSAMMIYDDERLTAFSIMPNLDVFQIAKHKVIAQAIQAMQDAGEPVSLETTVATLKKSGLIKEAGGVPYVAKIYSSLKKFGHVEIHCRILIEHYLKAKAYFVASDLFAAANSEAGDIFDFITKIQHQLDGLLHQQVSKSDDSFTNQLDISAKIFFNTANGQVSGYSTGIKALDHLCGGLVDGELTIVGARPGQGKSALVVSLMRNLAKQGVGCGLFSLEMTKHELVQRLASQESQVFAFRIKQGDLNQYDRTSLAESIKRMKSWNIRIHDEGNLNISNIKAKATIWKNKFGIKVIFIDYIGLINSVNPKETNRVNVVSEISRGLKLLAKDLQMPIVALSQLSRRVEERSDKMPIMSDLRESGSVEQDADVIWMMMRPEYYFEKSSTFKINGQELSNEGLCLIDQVKMRSGSTGIIPLRFDAPLMRIRDYYE